MSKFTVYLSIYLPIYLSFERREGGDQRIIDRNPYVSHFEIQSDIQYPISSSEHGISD